MTQQNYKLAIDFGTSRTKVAYFDEHNNRPELIEIGRNVLTMIPTVFYVPKAGEGNILVGDDAEEMLDHDPDGYVIALKKEIHKPGKIRLGSGRSIERVELASHLFQYIKEFVEKHIPAFYKKTIDSCILTVPVCFSEPQRDAIRRAAEKGGFRHVRVIEKPVAAAKAWLFATHTQGINNVIVCDIGGGTTDFAVVQYKNGIFQPIPEIPTKGFNWGGDDLDERILESAQENNNDDSDESQSFWNKVFSWKNAFKSKVRRIKEFLRKNRKPEHGIDIKGNGFILKQETINQCVGDFTDQICNELKPYIKLCREKLKVENIPVLLVGGSSQLLGLEGKIKAIAGDANTFCWSRSEYAVVLGAAMDGIKTSTTQNLGHVLKLLNTRIRSEEPIIYDQSDNDFVHQFRL
ncbi:MAG: Hsp70 family protein [Planctomycetaceae bacterium]|jgi:molecular chaperone DnaK (HSP70)|nr:Hsp70 family protein [Planctomycetaceae bacterium]